MGKDLNGKELGTGISQRPDGIYMARAQCCGKPICIYGRNYQKLKKELEEKKKLARENNGRIPEQYTLSDWFEIWFTTYKEPTVSEQSVGPMRSKVKVFLDRIGDKKLADISSIDIQQIINATMIETEYARKSINEASNRLKACFDSAVNNGLVQRNPFVDVIISTSKSTVEDPPEQIRFLDQEQIAEFLNQIVDSWWYECFYIMIYTGMRIGEVGGLKWSDIDYENKCIHINRGLLCYYKKGEKVIKLGPPKTSNSYRTIPFIGNVETMFRRQKEKLEAYKKRYKGPIDLPDDMQDLVFLTQKASPVTRYPAEHALTDITKAIDINRAYNAAKAGKEFVPFVKLHPHALRHTFCSLCYESGVDAKACQTLMGHANISTTMNIYTHLSGKRIRTETQKVDQLIKAEPVKGKGKNYQKSNVI